MTAATSPIRLRVLDLLAGLGFIPTQNTAATSSPRAVEASGAGSPAAPLVDLSTAGSREIAQIVRERMKQ